MDIRLIKKEEKQQLKEKEESKNKQEEFDKLLLSSPIIKEILNKLSINSK